MWRAFVYDAERRSRSRQARLRGVRAARRTFRDNVFAQVKNGPLDFQPREPFHPLFGAMPKTPLMAELQITQEYLGPVQRTSCTWRRCGRSSSTPTRYAKGPGSLVAKVIDGSLERQARDRHRGRRQHRAATRNWTGHDFAQANWYAFGRLAWDPGAERRRDRRRVDPR